MCASALASAPRTQPSSLRIALLCRVVKFETFAERRPSMKACNARLLASSILFGCKRNASEAEDDCFALCLKAPHRKSAAPSTSTRKAAPNKAKVSVGWGALAFALTGASVGLVRGLVGVLEAVLLLEAASPGSEARGAICLSGRVETRRRWP